MNLNSQSEVLDRISAALEAADAVFRKFTAGAIEAEFKAGHDPVTEADRAVDAVLKRELLREHEGWLSEESVDDLARLEKRCVWVVDPLDGTREFVQGIPEFCISIAYVVDGRPVAGGIRNPATAETFLGALEMGVLYNGRPAQASQRRELSGALVLASRSEVKRGEWKQFDSARFQVRPMGSVAYKLALVAAGKADLTFTLVPKNEWDVAAGAALIHAGGGFTEVLGRASLQCNQKNTLLPGLLAGGPYLREELLGLIEPQMLTNRSQG